ncbi:methyltransferase domain-containing protein [Cognatiyoonia sp. IB215446]|uniref:protein-L-isoaspartate O-methyltransferase family protein n=1 Tax=Cognatiyoonia sp. IB215446 TaxID=3097355 RepID=UPI002A11D313|nr:methyltransferase domain-containing protein [Cognatiyoonia sp. IB215446]MDX8347526.1 methyltransferase domain-containing protein [Cognatiyoonia sp. IB215446]
MNADTFVDQLRILGALEEGPATDRVLDAFKAVAREDFAGPGPWKLRSPHEGFSLPVQVTPDADPKWLYNAVLIVMDEEKGINIGDPVFWARRFLRADIKPGARILQVGTGVGYYTAILRQLAGPEGRVLAYEVESDLAKRAEKNLAHWPNVTVRHGNAATDLEDDEDFDLVVAFAGVTHIPDIWSSRLAAGGRVLVPFTGADWWGATILAEKRGDGFEAVTLGRCGVYPCAGARDDALADRITALFRDASRLADWRLRIVTENGAIRIEPST